MTPPQQLQAAFMANDPAGVQAAVQFEKEMRSWTTPDNYRQIQLMVQSTVQQMRDSPITAKQSQAAWLSNATAQLTNGLG